MIREHSAHIPHNLSDHRVVMLRHLRVIGLPHGESRRPAPPYENSTNLPNRNRGNPRNRTASPTPAKQLVVARMRGQRPWRVMVFGTVCAPPNDSCLSCLSLWERPAAGRVRVPSAAEPSTKAPSPRPSPSGRGRTKIDSSVAKAGHRICAEHHCHGWRFLREAARRRRAPSRSEDVFVRAQAKRLVIARKCGQRPWMAIFV